MPLLASSAVVVIMGHEAVSNHMHIHELLVYCGYLAMLGVLLFAALMLLALPKFGTARRSRTAADPGPAECSGKHTAEVSPTQMVVKAPND